MKIHGFDHVEYYVEDLEKSAEGLCGSWGFRLAGRSAAGCGQRSVLLRHGRVKILLTAPASANDPVAAYLARHGDGIAMIAFTTDDVRQTFDDVVAAGGKGLAAPSFTKSGHDRVGTAVVGGFGDVTHKLVERTDPDGEFAPGFIVMEPDGEDPGAGEPGADELLNELDHVAVCLPAGELDRTVCFYRDVFGLAQIYDERIEVGSQAMLSKVVQDRDGLVTFTLIEPDTTLEPGQIDDFLRSHGGAGVQHLAFRTRDIATAVAASSARGVEFLVAPAGYYQALEGRLGKLAIPLGVLRGLNVLADRDRWGQMFQIFARSTHERRTLFFELIERQGALTFGTRNIRALYEALQDTRPTSPPDLRSRWIGSKGATMTTTSQFTLTAAELDLLPTDAEVEHYRKHGWYLTPKLFSDEEIDALIEASDQFYSGHRDRTLPQRPPNLAYWEPSHGSVQRHNDYVHYESDALASILRKPLVGAVAARLAETTQIRVFQATMIYKPPNPDEVTNLVPWHADRHYWQTCTSDQMLTAFIPFHDCGEQMGTITMIDGSHRWEDIPGDDSTRHFAQRDRSELEELLQKTAEYNGGSVNAIPMIIPKGHMSFHHCRIYHGSGHNQSSTPRRAISLHLQDGDNQWRPFQKADGTKVVYNNDILVRTTLAGAPDYADPDFCPVTWQC